MAKHTELFLCLLFLKYSNFFLVRRNFFWSEFIYAQFKIYTAGEAGQQRMRSFSICTTDGSYDGKTPNVASSPRRLSGPFRVVALGGPTEDKFDACAHECNCYLTVAEPIRRQIESSPMYFCNRRNYESKIPSVALKNVLLR